MESPELPVVDSSGRGHVSSGPWMLGVLELGTVEDAAFCRSGAGVQ